MTQHWSANAIVDMIRNVFAFIDLVVYTLLGWMYQILFNVAGWDIFTSETVRGIYGRVQMILGVFMMFRLAITIIQGIINPDTFTDKKSGIGNIITRVVFALIMLTLLTPLNISGAGGNSYYTEVNNNGILFGTLYSLQDRILKNNVLGKLILGTNAAEADGNSQNAIVNQGDEFTKMSNVFTSTILKTFVRINLKDPDDLGISEDQLDENNASHRMCSNINSGTLNIYNREDVSPSQLFGLINASCETNGGAFASILSGFKRLAGTDRYVFAYLPILSTIVAGILIYILVGEIITIAVRSLKLAVLRVMAPIPVISYIQPSKDNGMFGAWMKSLISTYIELFLHLAIIYFVLYLVQDIIHNGIEFPEAGFMVNAFSLIFLIIGLFFFIKMAPKFIMSSLGLKGGGGNIGLAAMMGGAASLLGGGGLSGMAHGMLDAADKSTAAYNQGKSYGLGDAWNQNSDLMAKIRTGDKDARGGPIGSLLDRTNYEMRERQARHLGIGANDVADADYIKSARKADAAQAKQELDFAEARYRNLSPTATAAERDAAREAYEKAYRRNEEYQSLLAKAEKTASAMDKDRANMGVGPRISDTRINKHSATSRINRAIDYANTHFGTNISELEQRGTYRSPHETEGTGKEAATDPTTHQLPDTPPRSDADIKATVTGHKRDLKNFSGTTDDSSIGSMHHGSGGGPGPGPGPRP